MNDDPFVVYGQHVARDRVRAAWAVLSVSPQIGLADLGQQIGCSQSTACKCIMVLRQLGIIKHIDHAPALREVDVPLIIDSRIRVVPRAEEVKHAA